MKKHHWCFVQTLLQCNLTERGFIATVNVVIWFIELRFCMASHECTPGEVALGDLLIWSCVCDFHSLILWKTAWPVSTLDQSDGPSMNLIEKNYLRSQFTPVLELTVIYIYKFRIYNYFSAHEVLASLMPPSSVPTPQHRLQGVWRRGREFLLRHRSTETKLVYA